MERRGVCPECGSPIVVYKTVALCYAVDPDTRRVRGKPIGRGEVGQDDIVACTACDWREYLSCNVRTVPMRVLAKGVAP